MRLGMQRGYTLPKVLVEKHAAAAAGARRREAGGLAVLGPDHEPAGGVSAPPTVSDSPPPTARRSRRRSCRRTASCTTSCATSTCRRRARRTAWTRCPTARPGTRTTSSASRRPTTRRSRSTRSASTRSPASTRRWTASCGRSASRALATSSSSTSTPIPRFFWTKREDLVAGYEKIKDEVKPQLPKLFEILPKADYEVRAVEPFREKSAPGGSVPGGERGRVAARHLLRQCVRPACAAEVGDGGAVAARGQSRATTSRSRSSASRRACRGSAASAATRRTSEGWGLYAESEPVGRALGRYTDPYQYFGQLEAELWRAIRLVVDTGLHSKGWTREQVLEYMEANSSAAEARRVSETERYMAIPGQALAYKIGQIKISELRARAEQALGPKFDVRKFHTAVLADGALPLDVLEAKIDRWIAQPALRHAHMKRNRSRSRRPCWRSAPQRRCRDAGARAARVAGCRPDRHAHAAERHEARRLAGQGHPERRDVHVVPRRQPQRAAGHHRASRISSST